MRVSHHFDHGSIVRPLVPTADERGYSMVLVSLLLVPMLLFSGFAVDVGGWYNRTNDLQRAADAAALAGVVWLPDVPKARAVALETAARNGFVDGAQHITITVEPAADRRLRVRINDSQVGSFFYQSISGRTMSFTRTSVAEYVLPVPLGSPTNMIGTGDLQAAPDTENFWLAVSGYCSSRENGDLKLPASDGNYPAWNSYVCDGIEPNTDYDSDGYAYAIETANSPASIAVDVYDGAYSVIPDGGPAPIDLSLSGGSHVTTTYVVRGPDTTPWDWTDNPVLQTTTVGPEDAAWKHQWVTQYTIPANATGTYYLQVFTEAGEAQSWGSNAFGLRAVEGGVASRCTTMAAGAGYSPTCPQVHGVADMSVFANLSGTAANFYLAKVPSVHAGKTLELSLFDPGEGATALEVLDPDDVAVPFTWSTDCSDPPTPITGPCSGTTNLLDLTGTGQPQPGPQRGGDARFNDRTVTIHIPLPAGYTGGSDGNAWWKIRYSVGSSPTDRTTWSARIIGDPVHLVEDQ